MSLYHINKKRIEDAITDFESDVDFELVPVITPKSSFNDHVRWIVAILLFLCLMTVIDFCRAQGWGGTGWDSGFGYYLAAALISLLGARYLSRFDSVNRWFISKAERHRQCYEKAQRIFFLKHLNELKRHNSIVLFISIMERKIIVLPDPQLHWDGLQNVQTQLVSLVQGEFKKGQYEEGFLKGIQFLKQELRLRFPQDLEKKQNEIPNKLIWWND